MKCYIRVLLGIKLLVWCSVASEWNVANNGDDTNDGSRVHPLRTITAAANLAQPGDVVTVHGGIYRERVNPPRGGASSSQRIVYQAESGETVEIKGSEVIHKWKRLAPGVWRVAIPNSFFGSYNPYKDLIEGDWFDGKGRAHHTGEVFLNGKSLWESALLERVLNPKPSNEARDYEGATWTWFCESDDQFTYLYANFHTLDPNAEFVEISVRPTCFYPEKEGCDYITVRGFRMSQAATQWAAPTAEQIGLLGTHWSKGWIIEDNIISDSKCVGITLGKDRKTGQNVWSKDPSKDGATHYNEVVQRAIAEGWSKEMIGSHVVRNNTVRNCEQAGICGSLGGAFSEVSHNHIFNIWTKRQFSGSEMAGIKLHAPIDAVISYNRVDHCGRGIWLDWMVQGTRITGNLCYENSSDDLFIEVSHGPFVVDNNLLLSGTSLRDISEGGVYVHNLIAGRIVIEDRAGRRTPYFQAHSTAGCALSEVQGGDDRFYNNLFTGRDFTGVPDPRTSSPHSTFGLGLWVYDTCEVPLRTGGNVYLGNARPYAKETQNLALPKADPGIRVEEKGNEVFLHARIDAELAGTETALVTSEALGSARVPNLRFENADGSNLSIDTDYFGVKRNAAHPSPGPFEKAGKGETTFKVW